MKKNIAFQNIGQNNEYSLHSLISLALANNYAMHLNAILRLPTQKHKSDAPAESISHWLVSKLKRKKIISYPLKLRLFSDSLDACNSSKIPFFSS